MQPSQQPLKILVVEDDQTGIAVIMQTRLSALKAHFPHSEVILVGTLADGLRVVSQMPCPDVTFLDLGLPDSAWQNTIRRVHEFEQHSPVIIITGHPQQKVQELMDQANQGGIEIIEKDSRMWGKLFQAIARALARGPKKDLEQVAQNLATLREMIDHASPQD